jgi:hypothetical protein
VHGLTNPGASRARMAIALFAIAVATIAYVACTTGGPGAPTPVSRPLASGETLGRGAKGSEGTPDASVRTLLSVTCKSGRLVVRTNVDAITAPDDCTQLIPQSTLDEFIGLPVVITYTGERLNFENIARGAKFSLNAKNATMGVIRATP